MKKIFALTTCVLICLTCAAQYAPWTPAQGPLNFMTLDYQNHPYVKLSTNHGSGQDNYESYPGIYSYGNRTSHKLVTTPSNDPCRCFQVGNTYQHESYLLPSWSGIPGEHQDTVIMIGCNDCSDGCDVCTGNSQIEYWFYPQEDESTLLVYFSFAEEDVDYHEASYNPRFYIEVLDGQTGNVIQGGYYPTEASNGTANEVPNTNWPYNRFLAVPSGSNSSQDHHVWSDALQLNTYYWAFPQATPTTFPYRECPSNQTSGRSSYTVKWFEAKPIAFDLKTYAEQNKSVKLRIRVRACGAQYHWAYALFAAKMIPGAIKVDACGTEPIHLSVPWGFLENSYEWHYGYNATDANNRYFDLDNPPAGITSNGSYDIYIDRDVLLSQPGGRLWPYYRCEMKSYTGVPFIYEANVMSYFLEPDFTFKQLFNNCDLRAQLIDSSKIYTVTPPTSATADWDTNYQNTQLIQWYIKNLQTNNFIPITQNTATTNYIFQYPFIDTLTGEAIIKISIQDSAQKCSMDTIKSIFLDLKAIRDTMTKDTVYTCEEKLPYVFDQAYFGENHTWSTEGTRRVTYDNLAWNGCDSIVDVTLYIRKPKVEITSDPDYCEAFTTNLTAESTDAILQYKWTNGETSPYITITEPGSYSVEIINKDSCSASGSIVIPACKPFLNLPNSFTPSVQDGVNDYFFIPQSNLIKELEFTVYNRHGVVVYHTTNKDFEWNGTENGKLFLGATYTYILRIVDYEGVASWHKGAITVL